MTRPIIKAGSVAGAVMACLVLCTWFGNRAVQALGIATTESVDAKIAAAETRTAEAIKAESTEIKDLLLADKKDEVEMWIQFLDFKANRGEANDFDMTLLTSKLRQREELLKKTQ